MSGDADQLATSLAASGAEATREVASLIQPVAELAASRIFDLRQLRAVLPEVLIDVPVALLLIDTPSRTVVYANEAALQLAGDIELPTSLEAWGEASELTDVQGNLLSADSSLLVHVLAAPPEGGGAVRARTSTGLGDLFWSTAIPLSASRRSTPAVGDDEASLSLLLFLRIGAPFGAERDPDATLAALRSRAVIATDLAFTISDPSLPDNPLQWVNPAFTRVTGYAFDEAIGRNCRFLQGPGTDPEAIAAIRTAIAERRSITEIILNYRKLGTPFWNQLSVSPVFDGDGSLLSYVGVQYDVTERVHAIEAEREAARRVERSRRRLELMAEITTELATNLDTTSGLEQLAELIVSQLADWVVINFFSGQPDRDQVVVRHRLGMKDDCAAYARLQAPSLKNHRTIEQVRNEGTPTLVTDLDPAELRARLGDELTAIVARLGVRSVMYIPIIARHSRILGTLVMVSATHPYDQEDLASACDIGRRAGVNLDNARLYEQEHQVAEVLQRSLLPVLPTIPAVESAAAYMTADGVSDVGGDFYELLALPDGAVGIAIGDVVGHDIAAAAAMGHLRGLLRASAWDLVDDRSPSPADVIMRVDRLVAGLVVDTLATAVYLRAQREDGGWRLVWSNAGHPPPLLRRPDGRVARLEGGVGPLLGFGDGSSRRQATTVVPPGAVVVLYTDGLVERRDQDLDTGIDQLADRLACSRASQLDGLVADATTVLANAHRDDVAVLAVRLT